MHRGDYLYLFTFRASEGDRWVTVAVVNQRRTVSERTIFKKDQPEDVLERLCNDFEMKRMQVAKEKKQFICFGAFAHELRLDPTSNQWQP